MTKNSKVDLDWIYALEKGLVAYRKANYGKEKKVLKFDFASPQSAR